MWIRDPGSVGKSSGSVAEDYSIIADTMNTLYRRHSGRSQNQRNRLPDGVNRSDIDDQEGQNDGSCYCEILSPLETRVEFRIAMTLLQSCLGKT